MNFTKGVNTVLQSLAVLGVGSVAIPADSPTWMKVVVVLVAVGQAVIGKWAHAVNPDGRPASEPYDPGKTGELSK